MVESSAGAMCLRSRGSGGVFPRGLAVLCGATAAARRCAWGLSPGGVHEGGGGCSPCGVGGLDDGVVGGRVSDDGGGGQRDGDSDLVESLTHVGPLFRLSVQKVTGRLARSRVPASAANSLALLACSWQLDAWGCWEEAGYERRGTPHGYVAVA